MCFCCSEHLFHQALSASVTSAGYNDFRPVSLFKLNCKGKHVISIVSLASERRDWVVSQLFVVGRA